MAIERERRYQISSEIKKKIDAVFPSGDPTRVVDVTFGPDGRRSMDTVGWVVRIRSEGRAARMEYKGKLDDETWDEIGVAIDSAVSAASLLGKMGLVPGLIISRNRYQSEQRFGTLVIDEIDDLGVFVEIELESSNMDFETVVDELESVGIHLGPQVLPYGDLIIRRAAENAEYSAMLDSQLKSFLRP